MIIDVVIPAYNEEDAIGNVIQDIPKEVVQEIIVVNNASTDQTEANAKKAGATVLEEKRAGYGSACLKGLDYISKKNEQKKPEVIVFLDGDYSDYPEQLPELVKPIAEGKADLVIGSRALGKREQGSMTIPQVIGNKVASVMLKVLYGASFSDLGPFRAIRYSELLKLNMQDTNFGWTVEMQVKAVKHKLKYTEIPVDYRNRIGVSKISGTIKGAVSAAIKIIFTILKYR